MAHDGSLNQKKTISSSSARIDGKKPLTINAHPEKIKRALLIAAFLLTMISLTAQISKYVGNSENGLGLIPMMDVDRESSVPTIFSVQLLFIAALLLIIVSVLKHKKKDKYRWHWSGLAVGFLFMAFDEGASIHELLTMPIKNKMGEGLPGFLAFAWIIPAGIIVVMLAFIYFKFILALPADTRRMVIISGVLYLGGSVGMEMIGGSYAHAHSIHTLTYNLLVTFEEMLEMSGTAFLIFTIANYIKKDHGQVSIELER